MTPELQAILTVDWLHLALAIKNARREGATTAEMEIDRVDRFLEHLKIEVARVKELEDLFSAKEKVCDIFWARLQELEPAAEEIELLREALQKQVDYGVQAVEESVKQQGKVAFYEVYIQKLCDDLGIALTDGNPRLQLEEFKNGVMELKARLENQELDAAEDLDA